MSCADGRSDRVAEAPVRRQISPLRRPCSYEYRAKIAVPVWFIVEGSVYVTDPTAIHAVADVQETPESRPEQVKAVLHEAPVAMTGSGAGWRTHSAPFQRSANRSPACSVKPPPTATHTLADTHDTSVSSSLPPKTSGLRGFTADQRVPSQRSAVANGKQLLHSLNPTAMHARPDVQDTPRRVSA